MYRSAVQTITTHIGTGVHVSSSIQESLYHLDVVMEADHRPDKGCFAILWSTATSIRRPGSKNNRGYQLPSRAPSADPMAPLTFVVATFMAQYRECGPLRRVDPPAAAPPSLLRHRPPDPWHPC